MKVAIIFDTPFLGEATGAVWIVESDGNCLWFERQTDLDEQSAVFRPGGGDTGRAAILRSILNVKDHYPEWSRINVSGVVLTDDLVSELRGEGYVTEMAEGFSLSRELAGHQRRQSPLE